MGARASRRGGRTFLKHERGQGVTVVVKGITLS